MVSGLQWHSRLAPCHPGFPTQVILGVADFELVFTLAREM
jgi:hypothetical protein